MALKQVKQGWFSLIKMDQWSEKIAKFGKQIGNIQFTVFIYIFLLQIQG